MPLASHTGSKAMPQYFLNIRDGDRLIADREGGPYIDLDAAETAAVEAAREMLSEQIRVGQFPIGWQIEICGVDENLLSVVPFRRAFAGRSGAEDGADLDARLGRLISENVALRMKFEHHRRQARKLCSELSKMQIPEKQIDRDPASPAIS